MIETKLGHQSMNFIKKIIIQSQVNGRCFVNNSVIWLSPFQFAKFWHQIYKS